MTTQDRAIQPQAHVIAHSGRPQTGVGDPSSAHSVHMHDGDTERGLVSAQFIQRHWKNEMEHTDLSSK